MGHRYGFATLLIAVGLLLAPPATGQEQRSAEQRFNQAVELAKQGNHAAAVANALEVLPALSVVDRSSAHKLLGYSFRKLSMLPSAWYHLARYLQTTPKEDAVVQNWLEEVELLLREKHVKITFNTTPDGAVVALPPGGDASQQSHVSCPAAWWFLPGTYRLEFSAPGFQRRTLEVAVKAFGDKGSREVQLDRLSGPSSASHFSRWPEWTLIGAGVATAAGGGVLHFMGHSTNESLHDRYFDVSDYPDRGQAKALYDSDYDDQVAPKMTAAYVLYGVGGAALVAGVVTWAIRGPKKAPLATWQVTPWTLPDGGGAVFSMGW
jgi:hypothetical protein